MENFKLKTGAGDQFKNVAKEAKEIAKLRNVIVEFDFNDIKCLVNKETVLDWLDRDYMNAHIMEWKEVGPDCKMMYDADTEIELHTRQLDRANRRKQREEEQDKEDKKQLSEIEEKTKGVELEIFPDKIDEYKKYVETNSKDGYSRGVVDYAEAWGKLMQIEISKGKNVVDVADETQKPLGYIGITGFMYGCAVQALSHFWKHGEELRKWHNKKYGVSEDKKGVVNPAILTIST